MNELNISEFSDLNKPLSAFNCSNDLIVNNAVLFWR
jgi:hypothetical protein